MGYGKGSPGWPEMKAHTHGGGGVGAGAGITRAGEGQMEGLTCDAGNWSWFDILQALFLFWG